MNVERGHRLYAASCAAIAAFALAFAAPLLWHFPLLWYDPLGRRFDFAREGHGLAMDWYGRDLLALAAGALAFALASAIGPNRPLSARRARLWAIASGGAVLLSAGLYAHSLRGRHPVPAALPDDCRARTICAPN